MMRYAIVFVLLTLAGCSQSPVQALPIPETGKTPDQISAEKQLAEIREHQERLTQEKLESDYREWVSSIDSVEVADAEHARLKRHIDTHVSILKEVADGKLTQAEADKKIAADAEEGRKEQAEIVAKYRGR